MSGASLQGRVVLLYGAGRAPGPAIALALAARGATVAANDLSPILLDPLVEAARNLPGQVRSYVADAARGMPMRALLDEILEDYGQIDVLINNPRVQPETPLLDMDEWDWQRTIEMNLHGPFLLTQRTARLMREQGGGLILNITGGDDQPARSGRAAYRASQQALRALSLAAADELMAYNIRVITLCPDETAFPSPGEKDGGEVGGASSLLAKFAAYLCSYPTTEHAFRVYSSHIDPQPGAPWSDHGSLSAGVEE
jgi:NAD(P)-dependent dehydrogenase (short-subunit alcohol dehydrogenase family)